MQESMGYVKKRGEEKKRKEKMTVLKISKIDQRKSHAKQEFHPQNSAHMHILV